MKLAIFDLDGVIVDTAEFHYLAWKRLSEILQIPFSRQDNERLKGVSRRHSLEILLELGGKKKSEKEKQRLAALKNSWYVEYLLEMDSSEILPGVLPLLETLRETGVKVALGSASKNAPLILRKLQLTPYFDAVVDGNTVSQAKPHPEVFLQAASRLGVKPAGTAVFEDAQAGIEAALRAGMFVVGIGDAQLLSAAHLILPGFACIDPEEFLETLQNFDFFSQGGM